MVWFLKSPLDQNSIVTNHTLNDDFKTTLLLKGYKSNKRVTYYCSQGVAQSAGDHTS
jgi:hypothetical protein